MEGCQQWNADVGTTLTLRRFSNIRRIPSHAAEYRRWPVITLLLGSYRFVFRIPTCIGLKMSIMSTEISVLYLTKCKYALGVSI